MPEYKSNKTPDQSYLNMARNWANDRSKAVRKKVGAILVSEHDQIISDGYNGTPSGDNNCCEDKDGNTKDTVLHAETAALTKLLKNGCNSSTKNSTMFQTLSPCYDCSKIMYQSGVSRVVYNEEYRDTRGIDFLLEHGVLVEQLDYEN